MINAEFNSPYNNIENFDNIGNIDKKKKEKKKKNIVTEKKTITGEDNKSEPVKEGFLGANEEPNVGSSKSPISIKKQGTSIIDFSKNIKNQIVDMKPALMSFGTSILINAAIVWVVWKIGSHVIYFNSLPRDLLKSMYPPGYSYLLNVLKENSSDARCTTNIQGREGGKKIVADYSEDQKNAMILKKTCCPELDHPIKEGSEVAVPCFPLGTSIDTVRNLNEVNVNYSVWDSEYEGCVLYGTWKAENESSIRAAERENKDRVASEQAADEQRKRERDAAAAEANKTVKQQSDDAKVGGSIQIGGDNGEGEELSRGQHFIESLKSVIKAKMDLIRAVGHSVGATVGSDNVLNNLKRITDPIEDVLDETKDDNSNIQAGGKSKNLIVSKKRQRGGGIADKLNSMKRAAKAKARGIKEGYEQVKYGTVDGKSYKQRKMSARKAMAESLESDCASGDEECIAQATAVAGNYDSLNKLSADNLEKARKQSQNELKGIEDKAKTDLETAQEKTEANFKSRLSAIDAETYRPLTDAEANAQATANFQARTANALMKKSTSEQEAFLRNMATAKKKAVALDLKRQKHFEKMRKEQRKTLIKQYEKERKQNIKFAKQEMKAAMKNAKKISAWKSKQKGKDMQKNIKMQKKLADMQAKQEGKLFKTSLKEKASENKEAAADFLQSIKDAFIGFMNGSVNMMRYLFGCSFDHTGQGMGWLFGYQTLGSIMTRFGLGIKTSVSWIIYSCLVASGGNVIVAALLGVVGVMFGASLVNTLWFSSVPLMWALYEFNLGRIGMIILIFAIFSGPLAMIITWPLGLVFIFYAVYYIVFGLWIGAFGTKGQTFKDKLQNCTSIRASLRRLFLILTFISALNTLKPEVVFGMLVCFLWYEYKNQIPSVSTSLKNAEEQVDKMLEKTVEEELKK